MRPIRLVDIGMALLGLASVTLLLAGVWSGGSSGASTAGTNDWTGTNTFSGGGSFALPNAAAPTIDASGEVAVDTTANQLVFYANAAVRVADPVRQACAVIADLAAADDSYEFFMANQAVTITSVGCRCRGTCSPTLAAFALEDRGGAAMTHSAPTCATTGNATYTSVTAANGLVAGEGLAFDVTNAVSPETDEYTLCVTYTTDRQ